MTELLLLMGIPLIHVPDVTANFQEEKNIYLHNLKYINISFYLSGESSQIK